MEVYLEKQQIAMAIDALRARKQTLGLVPTMGALHKGHLQLVKKALQDNDIVIVSIFVNPTQFNNTDDLKAYPRNLENDIAILRTLCKGSILVYAPTVDDIYEGRPVLQKFDFDGLDFEMEGKFRHNHFNGVGTIVKRFFEIIKPDNAYFGEKDFQQLVIIRKLVEKHDIPVNIIACKIHREASGLAMSSRNTRLKPEYKKVAPFIFKILTATKNQFGTKSAAKISNWVEKQFEKQGLLKLEYFVIADAHSLKPLCRKSKKNQYRAFIAVYADDIRLIDNIALN